MAVPTLRQKKLARETLRQRNGETPQAIGSANDIAQLLSDQAETMAQQWGWNEAEKHRSFHNLCKHVAVGAYQCHLRFNPSLPGYELWLGYAGDSAYKKDETAQA